MKLKNKLLLGSLTAVLLAVMSFSAWKIWVIRSEYHAGEKYLRGREREIILFEASARALKAAGVGDKFPDLGKLREEYSRLSEEKNRLYAEYGSLRKRMREYDAVKQNIDSIPSPNRGQEQDKAL